MTRDLAIVISTRDRPVACEMAWRSAAEIAPDAQLIVVEQVIDGEEYPIAEDYPGLWLRQSTVGVSRGRNLGLSYVDRSTVLFLDDDARIIPGFLDLLRAHNRSRADVTCGRFRFGGVSGGPHEPRAITPRRIGALFLESSALWDSASIRRLGGFDQRLGVGRELGAEEGSELLGRLVASGSSALCFEPIDAFDHPPVNDPTESKSRSYGRGLGALLVLGPSRWLTHYVVYTTVRTLLAVVVFSMRGSFAAARIRAARFVGIVEGFWRAAKVRRSGEGATGLEANESTVVREPTEARG